MKNKHKKLTINLSLTAVILAVFFLTKGNRLWLWLIIVTVYGLQSVLFKFFTD